jgi:hypothetical protein
MDPGGRPVAADRMPWRPDEAGWLRGREMRWIPAMAVLVVIAIVSLGGYVVAGVLDAPAGPPIGFPGLVSVQPLSGWEPAATVSAGGRPAKRLTRGSGTLAIVDWGLSPGDADALATSVVDELLVPTFSQLSVSDRLEPILLSDGTPGVRFSFVGVDAQSGGAVEGEVTTVVDPAGSGIAFVGLVPEGQLSFVDGDLHTMVERAEVI